MLKKYGLILFFWMGLISMVSAKSGLDLDSKTQKMVATKASVSVQNVKLRSIKGGLMDLSFYKGKVVVINFFATWCPPCIKEIPDFVQLQAQYNAKGLQFIGICVDGTKAEAADFVKTHKINYPVAMDNQDLTSIFGDIQGVPTTFIVDRNLKIVDQWVGYKNRSAVEEKLRKWL